MPARRVAQPDHDPTPDPTSNIRPGVSAREAFALALAEMDLAASREAGKLYGDDELLELEAIALGTHPKQRKLETRELDETKRQAASALVQIRAKLGV